MKKFLKGIVWVCLLALVGTGCFYGYKAYQQRGGFPEKQKTERPAWVADKPAPETVEPGAYLAALNAVYEEDLQRSAEYYAQAASGDMENEQLLKEAYFFNALVGSFNALNPWVDKMQASHRSYLFGDYVKVAYAFQAHDWALARSYIMSQKGQALEAIINPLLLAWTYAGENNYAEAIKALEPLKQKKADAYYSYHKGLIAMMLGQNFEADEAFQNLATQKLPVFSLYPNIRSFYVRQGSWTVENPFYLQWQLFVTEQPATAELIMQAPVKEMTANRGAAEVFYNLSTAMGSGQNEYERALILSAFSLFLEPNQELPKIWSAEILEQAQKPRLANYFYAHLGPIASQTIDFKKAMNLIACGRESEAKAILLKLMPRNQNNTALWWALASIFQSEKNWSSALHAYTRIAEIEGESNRERASEVYFARAFIYSEMGQQMRSESDLQHALALNPQNPMLLNHLGYTWLERDETLDKGVALVEQAYQLKSSDPHIIDSMAFAYYRKKDYGKALPLAEKTVDMMPQSSVANAHLGDIYAALGRRREAIFQYKKALALKYDLTPALKQELSQKIAQDK